MSTSLPEQPVAYETQAAKFHLQQPSKAFSTTSSSTFSSRQRLNAIQESNMPIPPAVSTLFERKCQSFLQSLEAVAAFDDSGNFRFAVSRFRQLISRLAVLHEKGVPVGEPKLGGLGGASASFGIATGLDLGMVDASAARMLREMRRPESKSMTFGLRGKAETASLTKPGKRKGFFFGLFSSKKQASVANGTQDDLHLLPLSLPPSRRHPIDNVNDETRSQSLKAANVSSNAPMRYEKLNRWQFRMNVDVNLATRELAVIADELLQGGVIERACEHDVKCVEEYTENIMKIVNTISKWSA